jgi:hypothetical protein
MGLLVGVQTHPVARLRLDEVALADYLKATPERARLVARRLANGAPPRELVQCGGCEPALLDDLLSDLAARGIVLAVEGIEGQDLLLPAATALLQHTDARASFAPRTATPSPVPAHATEALGPEACVSPSVPICVVTSPTPAPASLEDLVILEMSSDSPEPPVQAFGFDPAAPIVMPVTSAPPAPVVESTGTPPVDQILALAEPTVIDDVVYHEHSIRLGATPEAELAPAPAPADEAPSQAKVFEKEEAEFFADEGRLDPTPLTSATSDEGPAPAATKRRAWPMVAFLAATGVVAWAVLHFSTSSIGLPRQLQRQQDPALEAVPPPPPTTLGDKDAKKTAEDKADEVYYTPVAPEATIPAGHGVLDVSAPEGAVVLVDGKERARGSATLPMSSGNHDVRVKRPSADESGCTIDVRTSRVAHVKF